MCSHDSILALRDRIGRIEGRSGADGPVPLGIPEIDAALSGGLARGAVHEFLCPDPADAAALAFLAFTAGRLLARESGPLLWADCGMDLFPPGLARYGCPPHRLLLARCRNASETLWTLEEGLRGSGLAAAAGSVEAPEFTETRRLQIAARREGRALLLLRPFRNPLPASAAATRWLASSRPSAGGAPRWRLELLRHRGGAPREWTVDFHGDPCRLRLAGTADAIVQTA